MCPGTLTLQSVRPGTLCINWKMAGLAASYLHRIMHWSGLCLAPPLCCALNFADRIRPMLGHLDCNAVNRLLLLMITMLLLSSPSLCCCC